MKMRAPSLPGQSNWPIAVEIGLILVAAFAFRVYRLDVQSLRADEGASVVMTQRSAADIVTAAAGDIHPPLYYLVLAGWAQLAGRSEFALRFLSLIFGVLVVALTYRLGRLWLDRSAALAGAMIAAASPLLIYYSQEARMYEQMALFGLAAIVLAAEAWRGRTWLLLPASAAFAAATLSQYFGVTAMVGASLAFVVLHPNPIRQGRRWLVWAACQLAAIALVLPWVGFARNQLQSWSVDTEPLAASEFVLQTIRVFTFGLAWDQTVTGKTMALIVAIVALSILWPLAGAAVGTRVQRLLAVLAVACAPPLTLFAVALNRPVYNPKFLLIGVPAFCLVFGAGIAGSGQFASRVPKLGRFAQPLVAAVVLAAMAFAISRSMVAAYVDPKYARDDYRGLIRYVTAAAQPGDVIILNAPGQREIVDYYYRADLPVVGLPAQRPADDARTERDLAALTGTAKRVWLVLWAADQADPREIVEHWLDRELFRTSNRWYGAVRLVLYTVPSASSDGIPFPERSQFDQGVTLLGYGLAARQTVPGDSLQLTLFWQAEQPIRDRYTVFTHLIDDRTELIWGQRDSEPASGSRPTTGWSTGETVVDRYGVPVLPGTPPGEYYVEIGLYRQSDGRRLGIVGTDGRISADRVLIGPVSIGSADRPPALDSLQVREPRDQPFGPVRLLGSDFFKLGREPGAIDFVRGDVGQLTLLVRVDAAPGRDRRLHLAARDSAGRTVLSLDSDPTNGMYPASRWRLGEILRFQHKLPLTMAGGRYRLYGNFDGEAPIELGSFEVQG